MFKKRFIGLQMLYTITETHFDQGKIRSFSNFTLVPRQTETLIQIIARQKAPDDHIFLRLQTLANAGGW